MVMQNSCIYGVGMQWEGVQDDTKMAADGDSKTMPMESTGEVGSKEATRPGKIVYQFPRSIIVGRLEGGKFWMAA